MRKNDRKYVKSQTKASKKGLIKTNTSFLDSLPKDQEEYLELLIKMTEKAIDPKSPDKTMVLQAERLRKELKELRLSLCNA